MPEAIPETHYARSGRVNIAYQVFGSGDLDLVYVPGYVSHIEMAWEEPRFAHQLRRLARFSRVLFFDKRGTGLSDRVPTPTLEDRMDDVRAVMDAVGSECAALFSISEGGAMSLLFAATYPKRTQALVLYGAYARLLGAPDYPAGGEFTQAQFDATLRELEPQYPHWNRLLAPSEDEQFSSWFERYLRAAGSPATATDILRANSRIDARHLLDAVRVPTLVLHRKGDMWIHAGHGRYLAEHIPGAKFVELEGADHLPIAGDGDSIVDEVETFLTGARHDPEPDRVLATLMFTDIVGSTNQAARLGDRDWTRLLETHRSTVRDELRRFQGREIDTAGDGFLAAFDGPARAIRCATAARDASKRQGIDIRAGLHTGECEQVGERLVGIAVHIGSRVVDLAGSQEVLVSSTVHDLVAGSGIRFDDRGSHELKGVPGNWRLYSVLSS